MDPRDAQTERGQERQSAEQEMAAELGIAVAEKRRAESVKYHDRRNAEANAYARRLRLASRRAELQSEKSPS